MTPPSAAAMAVYPPCGRPVTCKKALPVAIIDDRTWREDVRSHDYLEPAVRWKYEIRGIFKAPDIWPGARTFARPAQKAVSTRSAAADVFRSRYGMAVSPCEASFEPRGKAVLPNPDMTCRDAARTPDRHSKGHCRYFLKLTVLSYQIRQEALMQEHHPGLSGLPDRGQTDLRGRVAHDS